LDLGDTVSREELDSSLKKLYNRIEQLVQENSSNTDRWLRTNEVANYLNISKSRVYKFKAEGLISCRKIGGINYYDRREIDQLLEQPT